jgi:hypothetical protein
MLGRQDERRRIIDEAGEGRRQRRFDRLGERARPLARNLLDELQRGPPLPNGRRIDAFAGQHAGAAALALGQQPQQ